MKVIRYSLILPAIFLMSFSLVDNQIPIDPDTGMAGYKKVVDVPAVSADDLYDRGLAWVNKFYVNPNGVLKTQNKAEGELSGKSRFKVTQTDNKGNVSINGAMVAYQITLQFKENKCRYVIDRIRWELPSYYDVSKWTDTTQVNYNKVVFDSYIEQTATYFDELTTNLENYMRVGEAVKKDDW